MRHVLADELEVSAEGGETTFKYDFLLVSAEKLQKAYERNEVAGDLAYQGKQLAVNGVVRSIDRSIGKNYFVSFRGGSNPYITARAMMADGFETYLAALEKGQKITLSCTGNGMLLGSATLSKCKPLTVWVEAEAARMVAALPERSAKGEAQAVEMRKIATQVASILPPSSVCFVDGSINRKPCIGDITALAKNKKSKALVGQAEQPKPKL